MLGRSVFDANDLLLWTLFSCRHLLMSLKSHSETRGADMRLTAAARGFVVLLLTVPVVQSQNGWGVTYTPTQICALKGSTVDINCTYTYPSSLNNHDTKVQETFWFTKEGNNVQVDLKTDPEYSGRVEYISQNKRCTLRITDLRESDSAEYKFRLITNQESGKYTGSPGVTLSVTDLQVQVSRSKYSPWAELKCHSSCRLPGHPSYIWYKNGQKIQEETSTYSGPFDLQAAFPVLYEDMRSPTLLQCVSLHPVFH
ncbi:uncharacterized protein LOC119892017 [Micropterus salmoides]|uniref:uncharacterized protein LOC119892017 n=1 Tax=Micropterus salmoides TaxID=27706 RepID=UPI0018ECC2E8|nr:uncharacterized protein LOC119892017 [Micropterus salmoides]